jgi:hypothetical protein
MVRPLTWCARLALAMLWLGAASGEAHAQDKTLTEGRPLTRLGDAFPIGRGEGAVFGGVAATLSRVSANRVAVPLLLQYSPFAQTQLGLATTFSTNPHDVEDPHSGDVTGSARINFGRETALLPAFATALSITVPTGVDARATIYELKGYASKTFGFSLYGHLNAAVDMADRLEHRERQALYKLAAGVSYVVPELATLVVSGDVFSDQARTIGQPSTTGLEVGVRYRLTANLYWDAGIGSELAGPRDRASLFLTTGLTFGFTLGGR